MRNDAKKVRQLSDLVNVLKNERHSAKSLVFEADLAQQRAEEAVDAARAERDQAMLNWENSRKSDFLDLGLEPMRTSQLVNQEERLNQTEAILAFADERLAHRQEQWRLSDLNVKTSEKLSNRAQKKWGNKKEEDRLSELSDLRFNRLVRK